ncbi:DnaA N-terminal domain-containing protein [Peribacillus muralis]
MSRPSYETWCKDVIASPDENGLKTLAAPNEYSRDWLEERYGDQ